MNNLVSLRNEKDEILDELDSKKFPQVLIGETPFAVIWTKHGTERANLRSSGKCVADVFLWDMLKSIPADLLPYGYVWLRDKDTNYTFCLNVNYETKRIRIINCGLVYSNNKSEQLTPYLEEAVIERKHGKYTAFTWKVIYK